jgi:exodeoxyribonuclease V alpha subunit
LPREETALFGRIQSVVYHNEQNGYSVLRILSDEGECPVATGCVPFPAPGETVELYGKWIDHPTYGEQFTIRQADRLLPDDPDDIVAYLSSGIISGIGPATAVRMVEMFGAQALSVLESTPERIASIRGVTRVRALEMGESFRRQSGIRRLMEFFTQHRLPEHLALRLHQLFGEQARDFLEQNPYLLLQDPFRLPFGDVDRFAGALGIADDAPCRMDAAVCYELSFNAEQGHVYLPRRALLDATVSMLNGMGAEIEAALERLLAEGTVVSDGQDGRDACYLASLHRAESYVAERIAAMTTLPLVSHVDPNTLHLIFDQLALPPAEKQKQAIEMSSAERLMLLTGGPGTGKTTTVRAILMLSKQRDEKVLLAAPTGRAARRLTELTGSAAHTIHRLLETAFEPESGALVFRKNEKDPLEADLVILDETSMVDIYLMEALLRALPGTSRLVMVGDPDQLPAVGPGNVLGDLLKCEAIPRVRLTDIFRQAAESQIILSAHEVNRGETPSLDRKDGDFFFLSRTSPNAVHDTLAELCIARLPQRMGIEPWQIQVLAPTRRGPAGTKALNNLLQAAVNPPAPEKKERRVFDATFRVGDRIMQVKNNYDLTWESPDGTAGRGVFNGDIGTVEAIDIADESLTVLYDNGLVRYPFDLLTELELAYAMTVHKSQGSEYEAVLLSVSPCSPKLLTRRVLYTAITRAKKLLILVGDRGVVEQMVQNNRGYGRYGALAARVKKLTAG